MTFPTFKWLRSLPTIRWVHIFIFLAVRNVMIHSATPYIVFCSRVRANEPLCDWNADSGLRTCFVLWNNLWCHLRKLCLFSFAFMLLQPIKNKKIYYKVSFNWLLCVLQVMLQFSSCRLKTGFIIRTHKSFKMDEHDVMLKGLLKLTKIQPKLPFTVCNHGSNMPATERLCLH